MIFQGAEIGSLIRRKKQTTDHLFGKGQTTNRPKVLSFILIGHGGILIPQNLIVCKIFKLKETNIYLFERRHIILI